MTITKLEQDLNSARIAYNISRASLATALRPCNPQDGAEDRLILRANEYGLDHVLRQLTDNASTFDLRRAPSARDLINITSALTSAYDANHKMDAAMAKREEALQKEDPSHIKAILIDGAEVEIDLDRGVIRYRGTGREESIRTEHVGTPDREQGRENEQ